MSKTKDILALLDKGFVLYPCPVPEEYYEKRRCAKPGRAEWFMRPRSREHPQLRCICLGCRRRCTAVDPEGWPVMAKKHNPSRPGAVAFAVVEKLSVNDLLRLKRVLRVDEAAWALNVSRQKVHDWVEEGLLEPVPGTPVRVTCSSVERILSAE